MATKLKKKTEMGEFFIFIGLGCPYSSVTYFCGAHPIFIVYNLNSSICLFV